MTHDHAADIGLMPAELEQSGTDIIGGLPITAVPQSIVFIGKGVELDIGIFYQPLFVKPLGSLAAINGLIDFAQLAARKAHPGVGIGQQTVVAGLFTQCHRA